jgi:hypothetical protein
MEVVDNSGVPLAVDAQHEPAFSLPPASLQPEVRATKRAPVRGWPIVVGFLAVGLAAASVFAVTTNSSLGETRTALASTEADLASATAEHVAAQSEVERLRSAEIALKGQLEGRDACIAALAADQVELNRIHVEETDNFNRGAETSVRAKADVARDKALGKAIDYYFQAYQRAFNGNRSGANASIDKGNAALKTANAKLRIIEAETKEINLATDRIEKELAALADQIASTTAMCQGAAVGA